jgi:hypothetical protein
MGKNMDKSQLTIKELEQAFNRILTQKTIRISPERKLSVKAVEDEAGLGDGTAYYYKDVVQSIKDAINESNKSGDKNKNGDTLSNNLRVRLKKEVKLKEKYREEIKDYKNKLSLLASQNNEFSISIQQYKQRILELENNVAYIEDHKP